MTTSTEAIELSIVMPCLNEAETLDLAHVVLRDEHHPVIGADLYGQRPQQSAKRLHTAERRDHETEIHNGPILYDGDAAPRTDRIACPCPLRPTRSNSRS